MCGCGGEAWDRNPLRIVSTPIDDDIGERVLVQAEQACGVRLSACPWSSLSDPYIGRVIRAYRWWDKGELETRYGGHVPASIVWGIDVYHVALNSVRVHDMREDRKRREEEARERNANR